MGILVGLMTFAIVVVSLLMILLVLIQRGRGGGLAGAFGGMGGQSAFGTRAGDTFTRITIGFALIWVLLAGLLGMAMRQATEDTIFTGGTEAVDESDDADTAPVKTGDGEAGNDLDAGTGTSEVGDTAEGSTSEGDTAEGDDATSAEADTTTDPDTTADPDSSANDAESADDSEDDDNAPDTTETGDDN